MGDAKDLAIRLLGQAGIVVGGDQPHDMIVHDDRLWDRVVRQRALGLGEAYQDGWWDAERVDELLVKVLAADLASHVRPTAELAGIVAKSLLFNRQTQRRARDNAHQHYDIGNDLFKRMLDPRMVYSCGYWRDATDLAEAQTAKLDLICRKLHLEPGMQVLDIGCGWGGFAQYAASTYKVHVTGISPAGEQVKLARERCRDLDVDIRQSDYRDMTGRFDRIVSVGMMEHVGPRNLRTFFDKCRELLDVEGMMLHHSIGSSESLSHTNPWFDKHIFPGGVLPSVAQIGKASELHWVVEDLHNFGTDYDRTLMAWYDNIEASWADLPRYDERFRRTWRYYLLSSAAAFRVRDIFLWQMVFRRTLRPAPVYEAVR
jgi:cyclopropane-fatty-acyl-phospholipid synthase